MKFNINRKVKIKLTPLGERQLRMNHAELLGLLPISCRNLRPFTLPEEDEDGWSEWQLWRLMSELGRYCGNGMPLLFETTIEIPQ